MRQEDEIQRSSESQSSQREEGNENTEPLITEDHFTHS